MAQNNSKTKSSLQNSVAIRADKFNTIENKRTYNKPINSL